MAAAVAGNFPTLPYISTTLGATATSGGLSVTGNTLSAAQSSGSQSGWLSSTDWTTFNNKQGTITTGNLTDAGTDGIVITGGTGSVIGSGTSIAQTKADGTHNGYLASADWTTFNGKQATGNYATSGTGDVSWSAPSGAGPVTTSLVATSNSSLTTLSGLTTASSLVSVGTITTGTWTGTTIAIAHGGTGQTSANAAFNALSPMTTGGDLIYGGASGVGTRLANGSAGQFLKSQGTTLAPVWAAPTISLTAPTVTRLTATGSTAGYVFIVSSANATVGATYTNNSNTYTVLNTISSGTVLWASGASAPTASGTLTKSGGTGDSTITFSLATAYSTYTPPAGALYLRIRGAGGGGGGCGGGTSPNGSPGSAGTSTYFGANLIAAGGGGGGPYEGVGGAGGTASVAAGPLVVISETGGDGGGAFYISSGGGYITGGAGGVNMFGGNGASGSGVPGTDASAGKSNTGAGGGGGSTGNVTNSAAGPGGGAGACFEVLITSSIASTYPVVVGTGGSGGAKGGSNYNGGAGGSGVLTIEEHYQ